MAGNLSEDEVIIIDSRDDIYNAYQIHFLRKDRISDVLPAIKCPSFKSETKIFKTSEKCRMRQYIDDQIHTKSIVIEKSDKKLSINLAYGDTIKITPDTLDYEHTNSLDKLKERYKLWEIDDCACKPKKIRVWADNFEDFKYTIEKLERISNINDVKLRMDICDRYDDIYFYFKDIMIYIKDTMLFNNSIRQISDKDTNFMFSGDSLAVVSNGNYYNFRLDERTKESKDSYIRGKI